MMTTKNPTDLIKDPWNGDRWQWRIYDREMEMWFDCGPSFPPTKEGKKEAATWLKGYLKEEEG